MTSTTRPMRADAARNRAKVLEVAYETFAGLAECHDRRRDPAPFRALNDGGLIAFHHCHDGIGGAQIDADDFAHALSMKCECITVKPNVNQARQPAAN